MERFCSIVWGFLKRDSCTNLILILAAIAIVVGFCCMSLISDGKSDPCEFYNYGINLWKQKEYTKAEAAFRRSIRSNITTPKTKLCRDSALWMLDTIKRDIIVVKFLKELEDAKKTVQIKDDKL